jgi:hypothetical protein
MSEQIQQTSELGSTQVEMKSIIPSDWQWEVIGKDARLQKLSKDPAEMQRILDILTKNRDILTRTDNITEQGRIWSESLQGYWQMTQDGRDFASLSEKDVDGLPDNDYDRYNKWLTAKKKEANVSSAQELEKLTEKEKELRPAIEKIQALLSDADKTKVSSLLSDVKSGKSESPAVLELKRQWATDTDIQNGKYDSYISASIIIENAGKFEASKNPEFQKAIRDLQSLGIPTRVQPEFLAISKHIGERFEWGERTEQWVKSIRQGLSKEWYTGIYYDGNWERYTLTRFDGAKKDIIMNKPPRESINMWGLSVEREIPQVTPDDKKREQIKEKYGLHIERRTEVFKTIAPTETNKTDEGEKIKTLYNQALESRNSLSTRLDAIGELKRINTSRKEQWLKNLIETGDTESATTMQTKLETEMHGLNILERYYKEEGEIMNEARSLPEPQKDRFDEITSLNLSWMVNTRLYNRFPRAQELLTGILDETNRHRDARNQIHMWEKIMDETDKRTIDEAYEKILKYLGTNRDILKSADIGTIKPKVNTLLWGNNRELKRILWNTEWQKSEAL